MNRTVMKTPRLRRGCTCLLLVVASLWIGACGGADENQDTMASEFARSITIPASAADATTPPSRMSSEPPATEEVVPEYISSPCDFLPADAVTAIGIPVGDLDASTVVASRDDESAEALRPSGMTALSLCDGGGISVGYRVYPTTDEALADCAANVRSNEELSGAQSFPLPEIPGATVVMAEEGGSGGVQWVNGNVSISLVANYDQDEILVDAVRSTLMTAAQSINSKM